MVIFDIIVDRTPKLRQSHLSKLTINQDLIRTNLDKKTQKRDRLVEDESGLNQTGTARIYKLKDEDSEIAQCLCEQA